MNGNDFFKTIWLLQNNGWIKKYATWSRLEAFGFDTLSVSVDMICENNELTIKTTIHIDDNNKELFEGLFDNY